MNNPYSTTVTPLRKNWWNHAKCKGENPDNYDLARARVPNRDYAARKLCEGCPVIAECAADVLEHNNYGTVRAGMWFDTWAISPDKGRMSAENSAAASHREMILRRLAAGMPLDKAGPEPRHRVTVSIAS